MATGGVLEADFKLCITTHVHDKYWESNTPVLTRASLMKTLSLSHPAVLVDTWRGLLAA